MKKVARKAISIVLNRIRKNNTIIRTFKRTKREKKQNKSKGKNSRNMERYVFEPVLENFMSKKISPIFQKIRL
jgi:hypothetical protein